MTTLSSSQPSTRSVLPYLAWVQAVVATTGSLYFSEVMDLPPCTLCWYQRLMMYPLVFVLAVSLMTADPRLRLYALPLSITGLVVSVYHNLLYFGVIPEALTQCASGVSCTARQIEWLGFITIPLLSLSAFTVITLSLIFSRKKATLQ
ncbi:disulfide oxidoreductase [Deinococcus petrolearius]|uniref:Probable disulfide formation protein n=1 Tax=Deinococcus petrolearius TaxID=1751295 RepID=A0ABW1DLX8_9DEIO